MRQRLLGALEEIDTVAFFFVDLDGIIRYANRGVERILGRSARALAGQPVEVLLPVPARAHHSRLFHRYASQRVAGEGKCSRIVRNTRYFPELLNAHPDSLMNYSAIDERGQQVPIALTVNEVKDDGGELEGFVGFILDCSAEYRLQEQIRLGELYEEQSGLLCWRGLHREVEAIERQYREDAIDYRYALIHINIDHYSSLAFECKAVADHSIRLVANWLNSQLQSDPVARRAVLAKHSNATEFLIYLPMKDAAAAHHLATILREAFPELNLGTDVRPFHTTLSMGVAAVADGISVDYAASRAANACYLARARGGDRIVSSEEQDLRVYELGQIIRDALHFQRIDVYAQKIVPLPRRERMSGAQGPYLEVLCRLRDNRGAVLSSGLVFSAAEKLGLARSLDMVVIEKALHELDRHRDDLGDGLRCSLNLSGLSVSSDQTHARISAMMQRFDIPAEMLCFEITESAEIADSRQARRTLSALRALGCRIAIDDFGSGYSNFQSLSGWPIDVIKIDGAYIRSLAEDTASATDVKGMIASARVRGIELVAEYVDNQEVLSLLEELGVDYAQGYHFHRPEPLSNLLSPQQP